MREGRRELAAKGGKEGEREVNKQWQMSKQIDRFIDTWLWGMYITFINMNRYTDRQMQTYKMTCKYTNK